MRTWVGGRSRWLLDGSAVRGETAYGTPGVLRGATGTMVPVVRGTERSGDVFVLVAVARLATRLAAPTAYRVGRTLPGSPRTPGGRMVPVTWCVMIEMLPTIER